MKFHSARNESFHFVPFLSFEVKPFRRLLSLLAKARQLKIGRLVLTWMIPSDMLQQSLSTGGVAVPTYETVLLVTKLAEHFLTLCRGTVWEN